MNKKPFVTKEQLDEITAKFPTPYHLYDEKGIRDNAKAVKEAFAWNKGYREYFAVKACPNPTLIQIMKEYGCGCDCSTGYRDDKYLQWYLKWNNRSIRFNYF